MDREEAGAADLGVKSADRDEAGVAARGEAKAADVGVEPTDPRGEAVAWCWEESRASGGGIRGRGVADPSFLSIGASLP